MSNRGLWASGSSSARGRRSRGWRRFLAPAFGRCPGFLVRRRGPILPLRRTGAALGAAWGARWGAAAACGGRCGAAPPLRRVTVAHRRAAPRVFGTQLRNQLAILRDERAAWERSSGPLRARIALRTRPCRDMQHSSVLPAASYFASLASGPVFALRCAIHRSTGCKLGFYIYIAARSTRRSFAVRTTDFLDAVLETSKERSGNARRGTIKHR